MKEYSRRSALPLGVAVLAGGLASLVSTAPLSLGEQAFADSKGSNAPKSSEAVKLPQYSRDVDRPANLCAFLEEHGYNIMNWKDEDSGKIVVRAYRMAITHDAFHVNSLTYIVKRTKDGQLKEMEGLVYKFFSDFQEFEAYEKHQAYPQAYPAPSREPTTIILRFDGGKSKGIFEDCNATGTYRQFYNDDGTPVLQLPEVKESFSDETVRESFLAMINCNRARATISSLDKSVEEVRRLTRITPGERRDRLEVIDEVTQHRLDMLKQRLLQEYKREHNIY